MTLSERLQSIDRRVIYLILAAVIVGVLLHPIGMPIRVGKETQTVYAALDALKPGSLFVLSFDYSASNVPELHPSAIAMLKHAFSKNVRVVLTALSPEGGMWANDALGVALQKYPDKRYGVDYINIGYKPGGQVFLEKLATNVKDACANTDASGKPLDCQ